MPVSSCRISKRSASPPVMRPRSSRRRRKRPRLRHLRPRRAQSRARFGTGVRRVRRGAAERGMGLILDFVPNHMGLDASANRWWHDVLQHGMGSPLCRILRHRLGPDYARAKGPPASADSAGRVREVLHRGELRLGFEDGRSFVQYFERRLPIEPRSSVAVLRAGLRPARRGRRRSEARVAGVARVSGHSDVAREHAARLGARRREPAGQAAGSHRPCPGTPRGARRRFAGGSSVRRERRGEASTASPESRPRSIAFMTCSSSSPTASRTGRPRSTKSTTGAFSTSMTSARSGWRTRGSSTLRTNGCFN